MVQSAVWADESAAPSVADSGAASEPNRAHCSSQEDVHVCVNGFNDTASQSFFAVYDGNGGSECARFAAESLHESLAEELQALEDEGAELADADAADALSREEQERAVRAALRRAFGATDAMLERHGLGAMPESGTTAVCCLVRREGGRRVLYTANAGDSRAVLSRGGQAVQLSHDHRATDADEVRRVEAAGGVIFDDCVMGVLPITRSLGHAPLKALVSGDPAVTRVELRGAEEDDVLVLASDGVWDVVGNADALAHVRESLGTAGVGAGHCNAQGAAARLCEMCLRRGSKDNITCIVVRL
eukprot:g4687.t1